MRAVRQTAHRVPEEEQGQIVYGTADGSVIQSVYIDRESLGDEPPESIKVVLSAG